MFGRSVPNQLSNRQHPRANKVRSIPSNGLLQHLIYVITSQWSYPSAKN